MMMSINQEEQEGYFRTTIVQLFFIFLCGEVVIPCYYDVAADGIASNFLNLSTFTTFFAPKCCVSAVFSKKLSIKQQVIF